MPEVSKIRKGGVTYDIKDEYARQHIGSGVTFEVVDDTLYITTEEPSGNVSIYVEDDTLYIQTT